MSQYTEILQLEEDAVENLADAYMGYGRYLAELDSKQYITGTASCFLISAVYRSLMDPRMARNSYQLAANYYFADDNPYGRIAAVCAMDPLSLAGQNPKPDKYTSPSEDVLADIIGLQYLAVNQGEIFQQTQDALLSLPAGRLGIPLRSYTAAFRAMAEWDGQTTFDKSRQVLRPWTDLLARAAELPEMLSVDSYHWNKLLGTFIPYEPEILATCLCFCVYAQKRSLSRNYLGEVLGHGVSGLPLAIALGMVYQQ
jgi:hypothetical protein